MKYIINYNNVRIKVVAKFEDVDEAVTALRLIAANYNGFETIAEWKEDNEYWYYTIGEQHYYCTTDNYWQIVDLE